MDSTAFEGHGFNILIQKYFSEEWEQIYQCRLKAKQLKVIEVFFKLIESLNQFSNQYLLYSLIFVVYEIYSHLREE